MKHRQTGSAHTFFIIGLVVVLIGVLGFIFWQNFIYKDPTYPGAVKVVEENKGPETAKEYPYIGWKTYTSQRDGYSIKYPSEWVVKEETIVDGPYFRSFDPSSRPNAPREGDTNYPQGYISLQVWVEKNDDNFRTLWGMSTTEWYEKLGKEEVRSSSPIVHLPTDVKAIKVNGYDAKSAKASFTQIDEVIYILHNEKVYSIWLFPYGISSNETVQLMLNSFEINENQE